MLYPHLMEGENQFNYEQSTEYSNVENESVVATNQNILIDKRSAKEKVTVAFVLVVSFLAVVIGITQFSKTLNGPIAGFLNIDQNVNASADVLATLEQQQKDTDSDGLTDYDELNVYGTSPYLADSDSDGFIDKAEIDAGNDPNCPGSDTCFRTDTGLSSNISLVDQQTILNAQSDPKVLRELLIKNGFPKDQLDAITDEQLLATYQQAISGQSPTNTTDTTVSGDLTSLEDLKNLTGAQIRQLMIDQGAPADVLSQVSDEELKSMFLTKLNSQSN